LYFFSGASDDFLMFDDDAAVGRTLMLATGIVIFAGFDLTASACPSQIDG
jgi:hypothetical protein